MKRRINRKISHSWQKKKRRKRISFRFKIPKFNLPKFRTPKARLGRKRLAGAAVFVLAVSCIYIALFSAYFTIKNIVISGNESIDQNKIDEAARSQLSSKIYGVLPGDNFLFADEGKIAKKLSSDFSEIEKVEITRKFPDGLEIAIKEKTPALIWCRTNCYFVNSQGVAFLPADGQDADNQNKHYIKVMEEKDITEEKQEGGPDDSVPVPAVSAADAPAADNKNAPISGDEGNEAETAAAAENGNSSAITLNEQISDESFINFTIDINDKIRYNSKLKIKYYKTKGTKTRELIAFTDKNTRIYFDATQSAQKQADNLEKFLEQGIEKGAIDSIKYIYLKNDDRVFYK